MNAHESTQAAVNGFTAFMMRLQAGTGHASIAGFFGVVMATIRSEGFTAAVVTAIGCSLGVRVLGLAWGALVRFLKKTDGDPWG